MFKRLFLSRGINSLSKHDIIIDLSSYELPNVAALTPWRNGSASDSRSEGCVFKSRRGQLSFLFFSIFLKHSP